MKHTPGPWRVEQWNYKDRENVPTVQTDTDAIAQVCELWPQNDLQDRQAERDANARLIAAAPDLKSIVCQFISCIEENATDSADIIADARALLAHIDRT